MKPRLYDIIVDDFDHFSTIYNAQHYPHRPIIPPGLIYKAVRYEVSEAAEDYWADPRVDPDTWSFDDKDFFVSLIPPTEVFWMECKLPEFVHIDKGVMHRDEFLSGDPTFAFLGRSNKTDDDHFFCDGVFLIARKDKLIIPGMLAWKVDENGDLVVSKIGPVTGKVHAIVFNKGIYPPGTSEEDMCRSITTNAKPFFLAFSFLSCANVVAEPEKMPPEKRSKVKLIKKVRKIRKHKFNKIYIYADHNKKSGRTVLRPGSYAARDGMIPHYRNYGYPDANGNVTGLLFGKYRMRVFIPGRSKPNQERVLKKRRSK